jgi:N-acetylglucosaminyldiphosphoundecaprenol N-acetyl-beta-D-mannosaminyltransferase
MRRSELSARIDFMGCHIDNLSMEETLQRVEAFIRAGTPHQQTSINVDKVVKAARSAELRRIINECALVNADGMPIVWASRLLGEAIKERVAGIDLFEALVARAAAKGWRVYFLGAREEVVQGVHALYGRMLPELRIAGCRNGYWRPEEEAAVAGEIAASRPDLLFVAISSPAKERFLAKYQAEMRVPFAMGVGGAFDVVVGKVRRAPRWMQQAGLEWFFRFAQEPARMFRRYFVEDARFFWLLAKELGRRLAIAPGRSRRAT